MLSCEFEYLLLNVNYIGLLSTFDTGGEIFLNLLPRVITLSTGLPAHFVSLESLRKGLTSMPL